MKLRKETSINNAFTLDSIINVYYLDWEKAMKNSRRTHSPRQDAIHPKEKALISADFLFFL